MKNTKNKHNFFADFKKVRPFNILFLTVSGIINAIGVTMFLAPVHLYDSGMSGTSMLLSEITPDWMSLSLFLLILNIPLFLYGFRKQGTVFTVYAIYAVFIYSIAAFMINYIIPIDVSMSSPLAGTDLLLCALFGGVISGVGSGLAIRFGGAMDGIEVMSVIFAKKIGISVGTFVMIYNVILYIICGIIKSSWILPLYSIIAYYGASKTVDFIVEGIDRSKAATIVTVNPNAVGAALSETFECGITVTEAKGFYSQSQRTVLYLVINRFQVGRMKEIVREHDPSAYISVSDISEVFSANNPKKD